MTGLHTYPLLQSQVGVLAECMQYPDSTQYNLPIMVPLGREVDLGRFEGAFHVIYESRVAWRLRFGVDGEGDLCQWADDDRELRVVRREMSDAALQEYALHGFCRPFSLMGEEPLVRVELVATEKGNYLLMDAHHLIMDGMSYASILARRDFSAAYSDGSLPAETYTVLDAAVDEREIRKGDAYQSAKAYHEEKFAGLDFATLSLRPDCPMGQMLSVHEYIDRRTVDEWCGEHGVSVNLLFQAAFSYVMSVLSGEDRIAYSIISHGRFDRRWRDIIGMFSRQLPVTSEIMDGQTVLEYISVFRYELMSAIRHSAYPITDLCRDQKKKIGACFNFRAVDGLDDMSFVGGEKYLVREQEHGIVTFDLSVIVLLTDEEYDIRAESSEAMNSLGTLQTVARAMGVTLKKMMSHPDAEIKSLSITSQAEELQLIELGKGEAIEYDSSETIVDMFRGRAVATPDATAVIYEGKKLTYKELDNITNRLAVKLDACGVRPGEIVGVMVDRSELMVVYPLAIAKAGGAYMPLDPSFPGERLQKMCGKAGVHIILTAPGLVGKAMPAFDGMVIDSSVLCALPEVSEHDLRLFKRASAEDSFVVLYTSGSSGEPKAVVLEHRCIANLCHWFSVTFSLIPADRVLAYTSFGFDAHLMEFFPALAFGASVYVVPTEMRLNVPALNTYMEQSGISIACFTTQMGLLFVNTVKNSSLRLMIVGGEKLPEVSRPTYRLVNAYGPTECTVNTSFHELKDDSDAGIIGRPVANTRLFVVDSHLHLLPRGCVGELLVAGCGVARGYLHETELTAGRFPEINVGDGKLRVYRTGDLVRWNDKGLLEFIGRADCQVKLRGFRIELQEIESRALACGEIRQSVALVRDGQLVLYYSGARLEETYFREQLKRSLPSYMIPSVFVHLDEIPLNTNGKIDRKALMLHQAAASPCRNLLPCNRMEEVLLNIAREVLGKGDFGITDNLEALGMSSINAINMAMKAAGAGYPIRVSELLERKMIRGLHSDAISFGGWLNPEDTGKPVVVYILGISTRRKSEHLLNGLQKKYRVFLFEDLMECHSLLDGLTADDLIERYLSILRENTGDEDILAFAGYSFGAELAYRLAGRWHAEGERDRVLGEAGREVDEDCCGLAENEVGLAEKEVGLVEKEHGLVEGKYVLGKAYRGQVKAGLGLAEAGCGLVEAGCE
ncbi:MAG: amino acid adenylation domain-containing protein, partial [Bacteroidales bacterium]|nr:amino acid adenylation domain-containing protein [Bacteroidales bacterium]